LPRAEGRRRYRNAGWPGIQDAGGAGPKARSSPKEIDAVVRRVLELKFNAGLFEQPYVDAKAADA
jgi:beta-glucosidase